MESDVELSCHFRFLSLSESQAEQLKSVCKEVDFCRHFKTQKVTASIELSEAVIPALVEFVKLNSVRQSETDIFISVLSEYDSRIVDIPEFINKAIIALGCKLVFSFTCAV
ncbi:hypothetical protein [Nitrosomonas aestuarii]|uniref:hypothetical protein n=1 Tax=Nitrosomonas aestuarii TaxID=52441 RepID=UPI000D31C8B9|nr:hypothetical protein [Nitrosomonas aestuarii]PTN11438.1 hypothetical protein C8R11_110109 [Nitrosomonas aestuarii]